MPEETRNDSKIQTQKATFGMGCFWAGDSLFGAVPGVVRTCVGYSGGSKDEPKYRSLGDHTEVIDIEFDPSVITYSQLLRLFWKNHEYGLTGPIKRQYMSLILYRDEEQRLIAEESRKNQQSKMKETLVTEIRKFNKFYPAEDYHQKYRLQGHTWLVEHLDLKSSEAIKNSPLAAKLNGFLAGVTSASDFDKIVPTLNLDQKAIEYTRKYVVERHGNGLYC